MIDMAIHLSVLIFMALLFAASGFHKITNLTKFEKVVEGYGIISGPIVSRTSVFVPLVELATATLLVLHSFAALGAFLAMAMFAFYMLMIGLALKSGNAGADCGCGWGNSGKSTPLSMSLIYRNIVLFLIAGLLLLPVELRPVEWLDWLTAFLFSIAGLLLFQSYEAYVSVSELQKESAR